MPASVDWCPAAHISVYVCACSAHIAGTTEHFVPCSDMSAAAIAARIRADGIDILIDLNGFIQGVCVRQAWRACAVSHALLLLSALLFCVRGFILRPLCLVCVLLTVACSGPHGCVCSGALAHTGRVHTLSFYRTAMACIARTYLCFCLRDRYLVYIGTTGSPHIPIILTDSIVTPPELVRHYTEKAVMLPLYQVRRLLFLKSQTAHCVFGG